jgi:hypothetical protein
MNRITILNQILAKTARKRYLEIGVRNGQCFLEIKATKKFAVDPKFIIPRRRLLKKYLSNPYNFLNRFFSLTSDDFFSSIKNGRLKNFRWDVVFIDGLHTYEQSLRDIENSLAVLDDNGFIVLHDCNPLSANAATTADSYEQVIGMGLKNWNGVWNGEVWKSIVHIRRKYPNLFVTVLNCDFGIGVITKIRQPEKLQITLPEDLNELTYDYLEKNRKSLLNLNEPSFLNTLLGS